MSKIGRKLIIIPEGVSINWKKPDLKVNGQKGELNLILPEIIDVFQNENKIEIKVKGGGDQSKALHGLWRTLINNAITGVNVLWQKKLDFKGVGYRAEVQEGKLVLNLGFTNPVIITPHEGVSIEVNKNIITVSGIDKQKVGQTAANIKAAKPVEPYKGKGIKYLDEIPRRKAGKAAKTALGSSPS